MCTGWEVGEQLRPSHHRVPSLPTPLSLLVVPPSLPPLALPHGLRASCCVLTGLQLCRWPHACTSSLHTVTPAATGILSQCAPGPEAQILLCLWCLETMPPALSHVQFAVIVRGLLWDKVLGYWICLLFRSGPRGAALPSKGSPSGADSSVFRK